MVSVFVLGLTTAVLACADLTTGTGTQSSSASTDGGADAASAIDASVVGGGCGTESNTGAQLCIATTMCPTVVVDTASTPHCGFRIRGAAVDLVCGCGTAICPMGVFTTCEEAAALLQSQTEQGVCVQIAEGRCTDSAGTGTTPTSPSSCNRDCMKDCGGGAACASVCNC